MCQQLCHPIAIPLSPFKNITKRIMPGEYKYPSPTSFSLKDHWFWCPSIITLLQSALMAVSSLHCQSYCKCFYDLNGVSICLLHPSFQNITRALIISRNDIYFSVVFIICDFDLITILIQNVVKKLLKKVFYIIFTLFIEHMTCDLRKKKIPNNFLYI